MKDRLLIRGGWFWLEVVAYSISFTIWLLVLVATSHVYAFTVSLLSCLLDLIYDARKITWIRKQRFCYRSFFNILIISLTISTYKQHMEGLPCHGDSTGSEERGTLGTPDPETTLRQHPWINSFVNEGLGHDMVKVTRALHQLRLSLPWASGPASWSQRFFTVAW